MGLAAFNKKRREDAIPAVKKEAPQKVVKPEGEQVKERSNATSEPNKV